jgi:diadenosine tetraphosphate (Ap4A) HIT family hydrolase
MPESAEEVYQRIVASTGDGGRLPMPASGGWDIFPWDVVDGALAPKVIQAPGEEPLRYGEDPAKPCPECTGIDAGRIVWEDEHWVLTHPGKPTGLPLVLMLHTREHEDFGQLDDELASQYGRISNRLVRIIENLPNIGRVHSSRWGDGGAHFHVWFFARTKGLMPVLGSPASEWNDIIPAGAEDVWRADLRTVASKLSNWGGDARA